MSLDHLLFLALHFTFSDTHFSSQVCVCVSFSKTEFCINRSLKKKKKVTQIMSFVFAKIIHGFYDPILILTKFKYIFIAAN